MATPGIGTQSDQKRPAEPPDQPHSQPEQQVFDQELRQTAEKYARMIHASPDAITLRSLPDRRYIEINEGFSRLTGYLPEDVLGKTPRELGLWVDSEPHDAARRSLESSGEVHEAEFRFRTKSGEIRWGSVSAVQVTVNGRECMLAVTHDITNRKNAEEALRHSESDLRSLVEGAPYGIYRVSPDGRILMANPVLVHMLGFASESELLECNQAPDGHPDQQTSRQLAQGCRGTEEFRQLQADWRRRDGRPLAVRLTGKPISKSASQIDYFEVFAEDITERLSLERQLLQSQKLDAIGRLAGGIAHDFNNLLSVILGHTEILALRLAVGNILRGNVESIGRAAERAAVLTKQLLAFSRTQKSEAQVVDLNAAVKEIERLVRRVIGEDIHLKLKLDPDLAAIWIDPGQLDQVLMNLVVNARDAMPTGGRLILGTANIQLDETYVRQHLGLNPGPYVALSVSDTGIGMTAETMSRIFEPFFTTKELGKGTGLGLSTVYGIVKQAGGCVIPYSEPGRGTTFKILFPRSQQSRHVSTAAPLLDALPRGSETILLVEDEVALRELTRSVLEESGYNVLEASSVEDALAIASRSQAVIDLLLTDVIMPGMSGGELAKQLLTTRPSLRVLFMSGYADETILDRAWASRGTN